MIRVRNSLSLNIHRSMEVLKVFQYRILHWEMDFNNSNSRVKSPNLIHITIYNNNINSMSPKTISLNKKILSYKSEFLFPSWMEISLDVRQLCLDKTFNHPLPVFPSWSFFPGKVPFRDFSGKMIPFSPFLTIWSLFWKWFLFLISSLL